MWNVSSYKLQIGWKLSVQEIDAKTSCYSTRLSKLRKRSSSSTTTAATPKHRGLWWSIHSLTLSKSYLHPLCKLWACSWLTILRQMGLKWLLFPPTSPPSLGRETHEQGRKMGKRRNFADSAQKLQPLKFVQYLPKDGVEECKLFCNLILCRQLVMFFQRGK